MSLELQYFVEATFIALGGNALAAVIEIWREPTRFSRTFRFSFSTWFSGHDTFAAESQINSTYFSIVGLASLVVIGMQKIN